MGRIRAATPAAKRRKPAPRGARKAPLSRSTKRTATKRAPTNGPSTKRAPTKGTSTKGTSTKRAPTKRSSTKRAPTKRAPTKRSPTKRAPTKRASARRTSAKRVSTKRARPKRAAIRAATKRARAKRPSRRFAKGPVSWRYRLAVIGIVVGALAAGYFFWLRDSSLVAVTNVDVVGVASGDRAEIVSELTAAGESMSTLHVQPDRVDRVAARFPTIESVTLDANFPHGLRIEVSERPPALLVKAGDQEVPAAADGTILNGVDVPGEDALPVLEVDGDLPTGARRLSDEPLQEALVVGAAPEPLRPLIEGVRYAKDYGVELTLKGGIPVRFGSGSRADAKWAAAAAVLADPELDALTYLDVRVPERPAAGGAA